MLWVEYNLFNDLFLTFYQQEILHCLCAKKQHGFCQLSLNVMILSALKTEGPSLTGRAFEVRDN